MRCPVCKRDIPNTSKSCLLCGFDELHHEFINADDAHDWEKSIVFPYRTQWKAKVPDAETWLDKEYECFLFHETVNREKAAHISFRGINDLKVDDPDSIRYFSIESYDNEIDDMLAAEISKFRNLERLSFSTKYRGRIYATSINMILSSCPALCELSFHSPIDWDTLSHIRLSQVETLYVSIVEEIPNFNIEAKRLRCLSITSQARSFNYNRSRRKYDLSGLPQLEEIVLRYCSYFDYSSFSVLPLLKKVVISDEALTNLSWLSSEYQLGILCVYGKVVSLTGLEQQTQLRHLDLSNNLISNIDIVSSNRELKYINLYQNPISNEMAVRQLGIPVTILTKFDKEVHFIDSLFTGKTIGSISGDAYSWIRCRENCDVDTVPAWVRKSMLIWRKKSYSEKLQEAIQAVFEQKYKEFCEAISFTFRGFDKRHRRVYVQKALYYYPFLVLSEKMQSDIE